MTPRAAWQQSLRTQQPGTHAPADCPCKDGHDYQPVPRGHFPRCARPHGEYLHPVDALLRTCADCDPRLAPDATLPPEVAAAVAAEREMCAAVLDAVVREHRDDDRQRKAEMRAEGHKTMPVHGEPGYFCEDFGCGSIEDLAAAIRQRVAPTATAKKAREGT